MMAKPPRDRRTLPSRQRTYARLRARVDRLEDAISHFYNVINELRSRVSRLEKKLKPFSQRPWRVPGCMPEPGALLFLALVPADAPGWRQ